MGSMATAANTPSESSINGMPARRLAVNTRSLMKRISLRNSLRRLGSDAGDGYRSGFQLHLEWSALDHSGDQGGKLEVAGPGIAHDLADRGHVVVFDAPAKRVRHQFLGHHADEHFGPAGEHLPQGGGSIHAGAVKQDSRRIDLGAIVGCSPPADPVEVFKREADRIHHFMAARAYCIRAMRFHALA